MMDIFVNIWTIGWFVTLLVFLVDYVIDKNFYITPSDIAMNLNKNKYGFRILEFVLSIGYLLILTFVTWPFVLLRIHKTIDNCGEEYGY